MLHRDLWVQGPSVLRLASLGRPTRRVKLVFDLGPVIWASSMPRLPLLFADEYWTAAQANDPRGATKDAV